MVFEELSGFTKSVTRLLEDESYAELQFALAANPDAGRGKSGGVRVLYYWWVAEDLITLADIYPKNEKEDLTPREIEDLRQQIRRP